MLTKKQKVFSLLFFIMYEVLIYLIYICVAAAELKSLAVAVKENVYMSVGSSSVLHSINGSVDHQFRAQWNAAHSNGSARCSCCAAGCYPVRFSTALGAGTITCKTESS